ncbi:terminase large subunit domain-containing protein [uncultured Parolsenella sp.]|uniref:terminase large subunit domain-containing protein n=1 Tax=uncultured Parolsenella sp. TaxID=2083008 RepID=UPI0027D9A61A|nr:terminase large subunit [uncultured Parolsenella sp.]
MSYRTPTGRMSKEGREQARAYELFARTFLTFAGESELCGEPYDPGEWLLKNIWYPLFGTGHVDKRTGRWVRRFRRALIGVHRGFGKSQLAAVIVLTVATMEPLPNGQYGIVADSANNTRMVKDYIKTMIRANRQLSARWRIYKDVIRNELTGQEIHVYPYKEAALQGKHFHVLVGDELHVWRDDAVWKAATSGQAKVRNALTIGITTAGSSRDGFLFRQYRRMKAQSRSFVCWLGITDSDRPTDRRCWKKIMAAGRVTKEELEEQLEGLSDEGSAKDFERYYLNRTPMDAEDVPFMRRRDVEACQRVEGAIDWGEWFAVGIDGAVSGDTLAVVAAQRRGDGWAFSEWCWERPGAMGVYDLTDVADVLQELAGRGDPLMCCDPARMQFLKNWLERERDMVLYDVAQTPKVMCPASELLARAVRTHAAAFRGLEVLPRHCVNATSDESKAYGRRLSSRRHGQGTERIDAAVAAAMAMWAYDNNEPESPGVWVIPS